jgi:hypothetical protein
LPRSDPVRAGPWALGPAVAASNIVIAVMKIATRTAAVPETISSGRVSNTATSHSPRLLSSALQAAALCLLQSCGGACRMNGCNILTECAPDRLHGTGGAASRWRGLIEGGHRVAATSSLQALDRRRQQAYLGGEARQRISRGDDRDDRAKCCDGGIELAQRAGVMMGARHRCKRTAIASPSRLGSPYGCHQPHACCSSMTDRSARPSA